MSNGPGFWREKERGGPKGGARGGGGIKMVLGFRLDSCVKQAPKNH